MLANFHKKVFTVERPCSTYMEISDWFLQNIFSNTAIVCSVFTITVYTCHWENTSRFIMIIQNFYSYFHFLHLNEIMSHQISNHPTLASFFSRSESPKKLTEQYFAELSRLLHSYTTSNIDLGESAKCKFIIFWKF